MRPPYFHYKVVKPGPEPGFAESAACLFPITLNSFRNYISSINHLDAPSLAFAVSSPGGRVFLGQIYVHTVSSWPSAGHPGGSRISIHHLNIISNFRNPRTALAFQRTESSGVWGVPFFPRRRVGFRCWNKRRQSVPALPWKAFSGSFVWFMCSHQCIIPSASTVCESHILYWFPTERLLLSKVWPVPLANLFLSWLQDLGMKRRGRRRHGDRREGRRGESDVSKMWEINSASEPPPGVPAALEGSSVHTARGLCLKICSVRWKRLPRGFQRPGVRAGPHGDWEAREECVWK